MITARHTFALACALASLLPCSIAWAESPSKDQCVEAHGRGQDARDQGKLTLARKLFLVCAQASCPVLVQGDCARFTDDLARQQSSLTFVARDARGGDLLDTAVHVDDNLVTTRLDHGKPHDVDPGSHVVRFTHRGEDRILTLVVGTGEKGRVVVATFPAVNAPPTEPRGPTGIGGPTPPPGPVRPKGPLVVIGSGATVSLAGIGLIVLGLRKIPPECSISPNHCAAPPGDPVFEQASAGMRLADAGIVTGAIGVAALAGGLVWYVKARPARKPEDRVVMPTLTDDGVGLVLSGRF